MVVCRYFHVCDGGLVPDVMHDLLEGAMQYEVKLMLKKMIEIDNYFSHRKLRIPLADIKTMHYTKLHNSIMTTDTFNTRLTNTELGYMEVSDKCSRYLLVNCLAWDTP